MKILHSIPYFIPAFSFGGPVKVVYDLSKMLVKMGHQVTVYTTDASGSEGRLREGVETVEGITIRRFRNINNSLAYRHNLFLPLGMYSRVGRDMGGFDIIHLTEFYAVQNAIIYHFARKYRIPFVIQAHGSLTRTVTRVKLKQAFDLIWGNGLIKDAARAFSLSELETTQYQSMGMDLNKIAHVPNGMDFTEFGNMPKRGNFRKKWSIDEKDQVILFLARIHKIKGLDILTEAFAFVSSKLSGVKLIIAGPDNGYLPSIREKIIRLGIMDKVVFTGALYNEEKLSAYADADLYVLPSLYETFPLGVIEAFACGLPVIVTDRCGLRNLVSELNGKVVPYDNEALSAAIIESLSRSPFERMSQSEKAKSVVRERYSVERVAKLVEQTYMDSVRPGK
jgi:glycosyltransferase involved in cell wall biosynthesis